jgi:hypothetical protein
MQHGDTLTIIADLASNRASLFRGPIHGLVVGLSRNPLANLGNAIANFSAIQVTPELLASV